VRRRPAASAPLRRASTARAVAHEILLRVEETAAFADVVLAHRLAGAGLSPTDRGLATELVYGTLAWQGRLDHHLRQLLSRPDVELQPAVRAALRLGLYQLLFLDRIPAYAAVDGSVSLVSRPARGLVNAVLRRAERLGRAGLVLPDADADPVGALAVEWSHPRWLVERWIAELGQDETARLLAANNRSPHVAIRPNRLRTTATELARELDAAGVSTRPGAHAADAIVVTDGAGRLRALPAHREGRFSYQSEASQLVAALVDVPVGATVLDACAAPGGKTLAIAERVGSGGLVMALDPQRAGLSRLRAQARRLGVTAIATAAADVRRPPTTRRFDAVLVDAPCSGLGTLRRHPELRWRRQPADVPRLATLQREILAGVVSLVRPGGLLVYAVCTRTRDETTDVIERLLAEHPRFVVEPAALPCIDADGHLRTAPHTHDVDGFFATRLRARA
jgi:16S rRNA (cytosine967-C5)-methyltransferase